MANPNDGSYFCFSIEMIVSLVTFVKFYVILSAIITCKNLKYFLNILYFTQIKAMQFL